MNGLAQILFVIIALMLVPELLLLALLIYGALFLATHGFQAFAWLIGGVFQILFGVIKYATLAVVSIGALVFGAIAWLLVLPFQRLVGSRRRPAAARGTSSDPFDPYTRLSPSAAETLWDSEMRGAVRAMKGIGRRLDGLESVLVDRYKRRPL